MTWNISNKNNGCGTAPGNLVFNIIRNWILILKTRQNQTYSWALCWIYFRIWPRNISRRRQKQRLCNLPNRGIQRVEQTYIWKSWDDLGINNLTPIWATDSIDEVTEQFIVEKLRCLIAKSHIHCNGQTQLLIQFFRWQRPSP